LGNFLIHSSDPSSHINYKYDGIRFIQSKFYLFIDFLFKYIVTTYYIPTSVNNRELTTIPVSFPVMSVTSYPTDFINDSISTLNQSVKQSRFPNIWPPYYGYNSTHTYNFIGQR